MDASWQRGYDGNWDDISIRALRFGPKELLQEWQQQQRGGDGSSPKEGQYHVCED